MSNIIAVDSSYLQALASNDQNVVSHFNELKEDNPKCNLIIHGDVIWEMFFAGSPETPPKPGKLPTNIPERHNAKFKVLEENNFSIFGLVEESLYEQWNSDRGLQYCASLNEDNYLPNMIQVTKHLFRWSLENLVMSVIDNSKTYKWFKKRLESLHQKKRKWAKGDYDELYTQFEKEASGQNEDLKRIMDSGVNLMDLFFYLENFAQAEQLQKRYETEWDDLFENLKGEESNSTKPQCDDYPLNYDDIINHLRNSLFPRILDNDMDYMLLGDVKYRVVKKEKQGNSPIWRYTLQPNEEIIHVIPPEEPYYYGNLDKVREDYMPLYMSHLKRAFLGGLKDLDQKHKNVKKQIVNCEIEGECIKLNKSFLSDYSIGCFVLSYGQRFITCDRVQAAILKFLFPGWKQKIDFVKKSPKKDSN
jgi:hypothetical protein